MCLLSIALKEFAATTESFGLEGNCAGSMALPLKQSVTLAEHRHRLSSPSTDTACPSVFTGTHRERVGVVRAWNPLVTALCAWQAWGQSTEPSEETVASGVTIGLARCSP